MVRDLLSAGGVVAVKLGQVIAEDPRVPEPYCTLLGTLRDDNTPMSMVSFYHNLPTAVRARLSHLGGCLGTGSVKQVHKARFRSGMLLRSVGAKEGEGGPTATVAVAVLRRNVEDEALASLSALQASPDLGPVAPRLGQLVYGEFNLFEEGEALKEFATTSIGTHPQFHVVDVVHHSPRCLVEEVAAGPTLAKLLGHNTASSGGAAPHLADKALRAKVLDVLTEFHRTVLRAFAEDGLIHSDIHLGNMSAPNLPAAFRGAAATEPGTREGGQDEEEEEEELCFTLFDVGQFVRVGPADTKALLWALGWISTPHRREILRTVAIKHLVATSTLSSSAAAEISTASGGGDDSMDEALTQGALESRIGAAFDVAIEPDEQGRYREQKPAWLRFLRECELRGVLLPKGAFAVSKMMDSVISQQETFGLPKVLDEAIEANIRQNMSWREWSNIAQRTVTKTVN